MSSLELRDVTCALRPARGRARASPTSVRSGEWLGLIGPNGAGKSSLLRAVVGLVDARGEILVDGALAVAALAPPAGRARRLRAAGRR